MRIQIAAILLLVANPLGAEELYTAEFPVSDDRMAALIELAADGNVVLPADGPGTWVSKAGAQVFLLRGILEAREKGAAFDPKSIAPGEHWYHAILLARKREIDAAGVLLEGAYKLYDGKIYDHRKGYCAVMYRRWNNRVLTYLFLSWWRDHVSGESSTVGMITLGAAAQLLALPLLFKLRRAVRTRRHGWALAWPILAVGYVELVPLCWALATGPAWAFAYDLHGFGIGFVAHFAIFAVFAACSGKIMHPYLRLFLGLLLFAGGGLFVVVPMMLIQGNFQISEVGAGAGCVFLAGTLSVVMYFLLLRRHVRLGVAPVYTSA